MVDRCLTINEYEKGRFGALFFGLINKSMIEQIKKIIIGLIAISLFIGCLAITLNHLNPKSDPNPLENIEKKLDEAAQKESVLTENEKMLEQESTEKEWQEVDNTTDK